MKLTDFSLIFIGVTLPIIMVVYINISYMIKAEEQEMYYQKLVDSAVKDATNQMKEVENKDPQIDYGYSGVWNKKVSVNAQVAVDTFFNSLYNNFDIEGNEAAQSYLQLFVPAVAIIDYNGVQVSSIEQYSENGQTMKSHVLKPKRYYTYTYAIVTDTSKVYNGKTYGYRLEDDANIIAQSKLNGTCQEINTIEYSMDDYVVNRGIYKSGSNWADIPVSGFYISDDKNNNSLFAKSFYGGEASNANDFRNDVIVTILQAKRKDVIANVVKDELAYAINKNNAYAKAANISYDFIFPQIELDDWYDDVENVGMVAFMQGLSIGNKYLNYKSYGMTKLELVNKYYLTTYSDNSKIKMNLYHKDINCPEYKAANKCISPEYITNRQQASSATSNFIDKDGTIKTITGFSPCPICNP